MVTLISEPAAYEPFCWCEDTSATDAGESLTSWTASSFCAVTRAYVRPPASNTAGASAPSSLSNPASPTVADPAGASAPPGWIATSWMPSSLYEATRAYVQPPISNTEEPEAPPRAANPPAPSTADPAAKRVPLGSMLTSWMAPENEFVRACMPPPILNASMPPTPSILNPSSFVAEPL